MGPDGAVIRKDHEIVDMLNQHFCTVGKKINKEFKISGHYRQFIPRYEGVKFQFQNTDPTLFSQGEYGLEKNYHKNQAQFQKLETFTVPKWCTTKKTVYVRLRKWHLKITTQISPKIAKTPKIDRLYAIETRFTSK